MQQVAARAGRSSRDFANKPVNKFCGWCESARGAADGWLAGLMDGLVCCWLVCWVGCRCVG